MPHLQFDLSFRPPAEAKRRFSAAVVKHFAEAMDTGTDHVAVVLRCHEPEDLALGRAAHPERGIALLNADIRDGRTPAQRRQFALAVIGELETAFSVPRENVYVVYGDHDGEAFQFSDRVLPSWTPGEDPLAGDGSGGAGQG